MRNLNKPVFTGARTCKEKLISHMPHSSLLASALQEDPDEDLEPALPGALGSCEHNVGRIQLGRSLIGLSAQHNLLDKMA